MIKLAKHIVLSLSIPKCVHFNTILNNFGFNIMGKLPTVVLLLMVVLYDYNYDQARQTRPNSGGVAEGHPRFDKGGGVAIILYFLRVKNRTF